MSKCREISKQAGEGKGDSCTMTAGATPHTIGAPLQEACHD